MEERTDGLLALRGEYAAQPEREREVAGDVEDGAGLLAVEAVEQESAAVELDVRLAEFAAAAASEARDGRSG